MVYTSWMIWEDDVFPMLKALKDGTQFYPLPICSMKAINISFCARKTETGIYKVTNDERRRLIPLLQNYLISSG
jgi:hypothetical protein